MNDGVTYYVQDVYIEDENGVERRIQLEECELLPNGVITGLDFKNARYYVREWLRCSERKP